MFSQNVEAFLFALGHFSCNSYQWLLQVAELPLNFVVVPISLYFQSVFQSDILKLLQLLDPGFLRLYLFS